MKLKTIALTVGLTLMSQSVMAGQNTTPPKKSDFESNKQEIVGLGTGAIIGGLVAGPLGAVVTGFIGILIGHNEVEKENKQVLTLALNTTEKELLLTQQSNKQLARSLEESEQMLASQSRAYENFMAKQTVEFENLPVAMQFKTGSAAIEPVYQNYLQEIAKQISNSPDLTVSLDGFSDRRGNEEFNLNLSKQRASAVKSYLIGLGVNNENIHINAYGETQPLAKTQNFENDFFDRRVTVSIKPKQQEVANNR